MAKKKNTMNYQVKVHLYMVYHAYALLQLKMEECKNEEEKKKMLEDKKILSGKQNMLIEIMHNCGYYREIDDIAFLAKAAADYQFNTGSNSKYVENIDLI